MDDTEVERIQIKVYDGQEKYLRALPLHHSQKEIETTDTYAVFEYLLSPTYDFRQELLTRGASIEVLKPEWLREEIKGTAEEMMRLYENGVN